MSMKTGDSFDDNLETAAKITVVTIVGIVVAVIGIIVVSIVVICCCICKRRNASAGTVFRGAPPVTASVTTSTTYHMPGPYCSPQPTNYPPQGHMIPGGPAPPPYPGPPQAYAAAMSGGGYPQYDHKAQSGYPYPTDTQTDVLQKASAPPPEPY